jgi:regulator of chromosome condensation
LLTAFRNSPANKPRAVAALQDLPTGPVVKLAAGGYVVAALTSGRDLYAWGGHPGRPALLEGLSGQPSPVLVDERDIVDVGVGESHLIALTSEGHVFAIGDNTNGQLGLETRSASSWTRVELALAGGGHKVTGVAAGPRNSFMVVEKQE